MAAPPTNLTRTTAYVGLLIVLVVVPVVVGFQIASAGGGETAEAEFRVTDSGVAEDALTTPTQFPRLTFIDERGDSFEVDNRESVSLGDGLEMTVNLTPFPPDQFTVDTEFELTRDGQPASGATFDTTWDMPLMVHGPFETRLVETQGGRYSAEFEFFMFGPWRLDILMSEAGSEPIEFAIEVYVWPA